MKARELYKIISGKTLFQGFLDKSEDGVFSFDEENIVYYVYGDIIELATEVLNNYESEVESLESGEPGQYTILALTDGYDYESFSFVDVHITSFVSWETLRNLDNCNDPDGSWPF